MSNRNKLLFQLFGIISSLDIDKYYDISNYDIEDFLYMDDKIVQDAIMDCQLKLLKYLDNPEDEVLERLHQSFLDNLNKMNEEEQTYFKKYVENLINSIGSKNPENERQRRKEKYE